MPMDRITLVVALPTSGAWQDTQVTCHGSLAVWHWERIEGRQLSFTFQSHYPHLLINPTCCVVTCKLETKKVSKIAQMMSKKPWQVNL